MGLFGDLLGTIMGGTEKPKVPNWEDINLSDEQIKAIGANLDALPQAQELAAQANLFNQSQIREMLESQVPGYGQITHDISQNIGSMVRGELPADVSDAVHSSAAAQALMGGYSGTGMGGNLVARDLGLTSLNLIGQGLSSAESWLKTVDSLFAPGMMNVTSMFVTPSQMFAATTANQENQWGVQWLKNQIKAMPDPFGEALGQFIGGIGDAAAAYFVGASATQRSSPAAQTPQGGPSSNMGTNSLGSSMYGGGGAGDQGPPSWAAGGQWGSGGAGDQGPPSSGMGGFGGGGTSGAAGAAMGGMGGMTGGMMF